MALLEKGGVALFDPFILDWWSPEKLTAPERVAYAKQQQARRAQLEQDIAGLSRKRDGYLASHTADKGDSFDGRVFEAVKAGAAKVGVAY